MVVLFVAITFVVAIASFAQSLSGFGFQLLAAPLLAVLIGPRPAVVGGTALGVLVVLRIAIRSRGHVRWRAVTVVVAASLIGMPFGVLVLARANERVLKLAIAAAVLVFGALLWRGVAFGGRDDVVEGAAGLVSGLLATSTGTSGPPLVIAFQASGFEPASFRASLGVVFLVQGLVALALFALAGQFTGDVRTVVLAGLPGLVLGLLAGERAYGRIQAERFRRVVLGLLFLSAAIALIGALTG